MRTILDAYLSATLYLHNYSLTAGIGQARPQLHANLMQRMTDVLSRMLNDPLTRAALSAGGEDSLDENEPEDSDQQQQTNDSSTSAASNDSQSNQNATSDSSADAMDTSEASSDRYNHFSYSICIVYFIIYSCCKLVNFLNYKSNSRN